MDAGPEHPLYSTNGRAREVGCAGIEPPAVKIVFQSRQQLLQALCEHRFETLDVQASDIVDMVSELRGVSRGEMLQAAVIAWFHRALSFQVLEVECHEQEHSEDNQGGLLLFRVRLQADHTKEASGLPPGEELTGKVRDALIGALPGDFVAKKEPRCSSLDQMVQISWTKSGSIELGGVAALGLVVLIVMAIGVGTYRFCDFTNGCPCFSRGGHTSEYTRALRELRERGAEFTVAPDGSTTLRVPPSRDTRWRCPDCAIN